MNLLKMRPKVPSLADAERAAAMSFSALRQATEAVNAVTSRFPVPDRRWIASNLSSFDDGADTLNETRPPALREARQNRMDFRAALAAEETARAEHDRATAILNDVRRAAEIKALGDGRAALVNALRRQRAAVEAVSNLETAIDNARETKWQLSGAIDTAEEALKTAMQDAAIHALALVSGAAGPPPKSPREVRAEIQDLRDAQEATATLIETLDEQRESAGSEVRWAGDAVKAAITHVVSFAPNTAALVEAYQKAEAEWLRLRGAVEVLARAGALPEGFKLGGTGTPPAINPTAEAWTAALAALAADPAVALPEVA